jgi:hypothetical protein
MFSPLPGTTLRTRKILTSAMKWAVPSMVLFSGSNFLLKEIVQQGSQKDNRTKIHDVSRRRGHSGPQDVAREVNSSPRANARPNLKRMSSTEPETES